MGNALLPTLASEANALRVELLKRPPGALVGKDLLICSPAKGKTSSGPASASAFLPDRLDAEKDLFDCFGIPALLLLLFDLVRLKGMSHLQIP